MALNACLLHEGMISDKRCLVKHCKRTKSSPSNTIIPRGSSAQQKQLIAQHELHHNHFLSSWAAVGQNAKYAYSNLLTTETQNMTDNQRCSLSTLQRRQNVLLNSFVRTSSTRKDSDSTGLKRVTSLLLQQQPKGLRSYLLSGPEQQRFRRN